MPEQNEPQEPFTPESAWKSQPQPHRQIALSPGELCALAQSREKLNTIVTSAVVAVTAALALAFLYNIYRIGQPWLRLGQAWTLGVIVYLFAPALERGRRPKAATEPCARFLERQHEERRYGYLRIRSRLFLFIPGIAVSWWSAGPQAASPWLFLITVAALVLVWFAFGKAAEKAAHDREEITAAAGR